MPLTILWTLLIFSGVLYLLKKKRVTRWLFFIAVGWLLIISTKFIPDLLVSRLENQYSPIIKIDAANLSSPVYIMVLGAGYSDDKKLNPNDELSVTALGRVVEGIRLYRLIPRSKLIFSGFKGRLSVSQADVSAMTAIALGVGQSDIKSLTTTRTTYDEAHTYFSSFGNNSSLILVTDAIHMPRAVRLFKDAGLDPIPAPTNHIIKKDSEKKPFSWFPSSENISKMEDVVHEYTGLVWYWLGGR
jgi:uncharacterized SAM-binding protein YcdF (DUF218 family)